MAEQERARALIYGLALGDALGWPIEFLKMEKIAIIYGAAGIQEPPDPAMFTEDTQTTLAVAEALLEVADADLDVFMAALARRLVAWSNSPDNTRAPGHTLIEAVRTLEAGVPWRESGSSARGNGSAIRVAPIGYLYQNDPVRLRDVAYASSIATHAHPESIASAVAAAYLVKLALDGVPPEQYVNHVIDFIGDLSDEFVDAMLRVGHVLQWTDEIAAVAHIGAGWVGSEAVAMAVYCAIRHQSDYVAAVRRAVNIAGDSDSVGCITGSLVAARLGLDAIPPAWVARLERRQDLTTLADRLAACKEQLTAAGA
ncbi:MAG: ADP-ribosylglycohydrolase family protein [Anaerolineae bacterium]|nr:ADP-ribosylglycohydrolase family protein [Anaerolineae bacterium]